MLYFLAPAYTYNIVDHQAHPPDPHRLSLVCDRFDIQTVLQRSCRTFFLVFQVTIENLEFMNVRRPEVFVSYFYKVI